MQSFPHGFNALVIGASGGIGRAVADTLDHTVQCGHVTRLSRSGETGFDVRDDALVAETATRLQQLHSPFHLILVATGALVANSNGPEKSLSQVDPETMAQLFAINAIGPALLLKHLTPCLPATGKCVFAALSARVGSIGDNQLGGWYAYRASKAALNQIVRTSAIEITRKRPEAICLALHPGTVETPLSRPFARDQYTHSADDAARQLLDTIDRANAEQTGSFLAYDGTPIPW